MSRRQFMALLASALLARPALAQRRFRVGFMSAQNRPLSFNDHAFVEGLRTLGYIDDANVQIEWRFADQKYDLLPEIAADLVKLNPDVIVATTQAAVRAAQRVTLSIPIVMAVANDPVQMGLIESLSNPGGNVTGASSADEERMSKQLDLLLQIVPGMSRVAVLHGPGNNNPRTSGAFAASRELDSMAGAKGVALHHFVARASSEIDTVFAKIKDAGNHAIMLRSNPLITDERFRIAKIASDTNLPSISSRFEFVEAGGLISYGESLTELYSRAAHFVDRILKGAKPSELPVELPSRLSLSVNQRTARHLGLELPNAILGIADNIIE